MIVFFFFKKRKLRFEITWNPDIKLKRGLDLFLETFVLNIVKLLLTNLLNFERLERYLAIKALSVFLNYKKKTFC